MITDVAYNPAATPPVFNGDLSVIEKTATAILHAKATGAAIILAHGAHLIKNGLSPLLRVMIKQGYVTHIATNGAGSIHDWEFAYQGKSEESVRKYLPEGQFGLWDETGRYINLALLLGAYHQRGYGEAIGRLIETESLDFPDDLDLSAEIRKRTFSTSAEHPSHTIPPLGHMIPLFESRRFWANDAWKYHRIPHPFKGYSVQGYAFEKGALFTVHPSIGQDIIYAHPFCNEAAIGFTARTDFLRFVKSVENLNGGVYLSVGSAIMSPMVFEKALAMARNVAHLKGRRLDDFLIVVNDLQEGNWQWGTGREPPKDDPAYYLRMCKTFDRAGAREMHYVCTDNRTFLGNLYACLRAKDTT